MTPERWQEIERLYHAALERDDDQRAAFLADACPDDEELCREVESLLAYQPGPGTSSKRRLPPATSLPSRVCFAGTSCPSLADSLDASSASISSRH